MNVCIQLEPLKSEALETKRYSQTLRYECCGECGRPCGFPPTNRIDLSSKLYTSPSLTIWVTYDRARRTAESLSLLTAAWTSTSTALLKVMSYLQQPSGPIEVATSATVHPSIGPILEYTASEFLRLVFKTHLSMLVWTMDDCSTNGAGP